MALIFSLSIAARPARHLLALAALLGFGMASVAGRAEIVPGEIVVGFQTTGAQKSLTPTLDALGATLRQHVAIHSQTLRLRPGVSQAQTLAWLRRQPGVAYAEPTHAMHLLAPPNDPGYGNQYGPSIVKADLAWTFWQPQAQTIIAVIDTGVDNTHPDLTNKILRDSQGIVGYNVFLYDSALQKYGKRDDALDDYGHGTHCSGIAAAQTNNGVGVAGIAGWDGLAGDTDTGHVKIMPVLVIDNTGNGTDEGVADGILWAVDHGAKVLSISLGSDDYLHALDDAIQYAWNKGCVIVAAAGNGGDSRASYPGAYRHVVSVAATDNTDTLAVSYTTFGDWVSTCAPGSNVYSTTPTYATHFQQNYSYSYGTSMATPHVAGEAALLFSQNPGLSNAQVVRLITSQTDSYVQAYGHAIAQGGGRINVFHALQSAFTPPTPGPTSYYMFPTADAYVGDGYEANIDLGGDTHLEITHVPTVVDSAVDHVAYLKFDFDAIPTAPASAILTLVMDSSSYPLGKTATLKLYQISDTTWPEKKFPPDTTPGVTWNTAPGLNLATVTSQGTLLDSRMVTTQNGATVTYDLTAFVAAHLGQTVSLQLLDDQPDGVTVGFASRESRLQQPHLVFSYARQAELATVSGPNTTVFNSAQATGTLQLDTANGNAPATVTLTSSNPFVLSVAASATIAPGQTTATFPMRGGSVSQPTKVTVTASYNGTFKTTTVTVAPHPAHSGHAQN